MITIKKNLQINKIYIKISYNLFIIKKNITTQNL
jgi:hypothetical protein